MYGRATGLLATGERKPRLRSTGFVRVGAGGGAGSRTLNISQKMLQLVENARKVISGVSMAVNPASVDELLQRLSNHMSSATLGDAHRWHKLIEDQFELLNKKCCQVVFVGEVGVGKSSALAVTANLLLEDGTPSDKSTLRKQSMLPTGAGRTTLCEIVSRGCRPGEPENQFGLLLDPIPQEELDQAVSFWAEDEWNKKILTQISRADTESPSNSQELTRALKNMAGYAEYRGSSGGRPVVHPLREIVDQFQSRAEFEDHLREKINFRSRNETQWWMSSDSPRTEIKNLLDQLNSGNISTALLPRRVTLVVPSFLSTLENKGLSVELIDARGVDGGVGLAARPDLQDFLENPLAIYVLCAPFKSAPGDVVRELLSDIKGNAQWADSRSRIILVLLDQGDAEQVNGADGDRSLGLELKKDECILDLMQASAIEQPSDIELIAIDVLLDTPEILIASIGKVIERLKSDLEGKLHDLMGYANGFLRKTQDEARSNLLPGVNEKIKSVLSANFPAGSPLKDPMKGALDAVQTTVYPAVIYAACRRRGRYRNLDLYEAIGAAAATAATSWITPPLRKLIKELDSLIADDKYELVRDDLQLRKIALNESRLNFVKDYSDAVKNEVSPILEKDRTLWSECRDNWGLSNGFKKRVQELLRQWSDRQVFRAHLDLDEKTADIPFWRIVQANEAAPDFFVKIKNLRAIRNGLFKPDQVSLLIGANGSGKSTLLHVLRFMRLSYERGVINGVRIVFGGSYELKNWRAAEDEAIEVCLSNGRAEWLLRMSLSKVSPDIHYYEQLSSQGEVVYSRDGEDNVKYGLDVISTSSDYSALKGMVDRGEAHPSIQQISDLLLRMSVFEDPDLYNIRLHGSPAFDDAQLAVRGTNVLTILRKWQQDEQERHRFEFVVQGLKASFPPLSAIDFVGAGNTLVARVYREGLEQPGPLANEANGLLQMLVLLSDVAQTKPGGLVAIDEPENGLHPFAVRVFLRSCQQWAATNRVKFILATHSLVLLDEFSSAPEAVFVMKTGEDTHTVPTALDDLCNRDWLEGFKIGDLYEQGEIGSNNDGQ